MNPSPGEVEAEKTPFEYERRYWAERLEVEILLLKIVQSDDWRNPLVAPLEVAMAKTPEAELYVKGVKAEREVEETLFKNVVLSVVRRPS